MMVTKGIDPLRLLGITLAVLLGLGASLLPVQAKEFTLQELLDGATIVIGDKEFFQFSQFESMGAGGAAPVNPERVTVIPKIDKFGPGLIFMSQEFSADFGQEQNTVFQYQVRTLSNENLIVDNSLELVRFSFAALLGARIDILEGVSDQFSNSLGEKSVFVTDLPQRLFDSLAFPPQDHLVIKTGILLDGPATVEEFRQDFSQVPEPATLILFGIGILGMLFYRSRQRKQATYSVSHMN